ncbi:MAG TPA: nitrilase-related carbon-nitrogen hydrolase [Draconibacterium sp.]|nr:nitrilase-related carbon-nitrogen hydrolase [Draconibacterium sp.]
MKQITLFIILIITLQYCAFGTNLRVASVQMPITGNIHENLEYMKNAIAEARKGNARVVLFPETALSGFFEEDIKSLDWNELNNAMDELARLAKKDNVYIIYGTVTKSSFEKPYNSALVINPEGKCIETYHKSFPERYFEPGEKLALFKIDSISATLIICHDSRYPELVRVPVMAGARMCFYISYEVNPPDGAKQKKENYRAQSIARAAENNIWYIQANGVGPFKGNRISLGNSIIVNNYGVVIAKAPQMKPKIIYADVEINMSKKQSSTALRGKNGKLLGDWNTIALEELNAQRNAEKFACSPKPDNNSIIRLALMQTIPVKWELETNFNTFLKLLDDAKDADIFITPECWLDGYAASDSNSTPDSLKNIALDIKSSPYLKRVSGEARKHKMFICFGFTSLEDGKIYKTTGLWNKSGKLIGIYHKAHLRNHDLQFEEGEGLPVFETQFGKVGCMICDDRQWPEMLGTLKLKEAKLILNPTFGIHHMENELWMRAHSYYNQCYIAFVHPNVGFVVGPNGELIAKRISNPGVLICDIDIALAKDAVANKDKSPGALHVQIIPDPNAPDKMVFNKDENHDGQLDPFFLCGPGDPEGFLYRGKRNPDGTREGDQLEMIRKLEKYGGNSIYFIAVRTNGGDAPKSHSEESEIYPDDLHNPWINQDPKNGLNEKMLRQWENWFTEMDKNNIVIYFFIYDDAINVAKQFGWPLDSSGDLNPGEKDFVKSLVNRFKHHKNLIWCVMEEGQEMGENWQQHISKIAEAISEADNHQHIIASHQLGGNVFFHKEDPVINQFAIQTDKDQVGTTDDLHRWFLKAGDNSEGKYSLVMSEDWVHGNRSVPNGDRKEIRQRNWAAAMAGCYSMVLGMDIANTPVSWLKDCRTLQTFFESTTFNQMSPGDRLAHGETEYVMANPGYDYILYSTHARDGLGVINLLQGSYSLKWIDCEEGTAKDIKDMKMKAGINNWKKPDGFGDEVALFLFRKDSRPKIVKKTIVKNRPVESKKSINVAPVVMDYQVEAKYNMSKDVQLRYDDPDGGPGPYSIEIISKPAHGTLSGVGNDRIYTPDKDFTGKDQFEWKVNDGVNDSKVSAVRIVINK